MNLAKLDEAIWAASRFNNLAKADRKRLKEDKFAQYCCKETAACKRASMDLTRALAELRKPG